MMTESNRATLLCLLGLLAGCANTAAPATG